MDINGKRVLLTGATGGIGMAIAHELSALGAELVITGRQRSALDAMAEKLRGEAVKVTVIAADLALDADLDRLIDEAGQIDILVANAGLPGTDDITAFSKAAIDANLNVNLRVPIMLARALIPGMVERGDGHLLFVSSIAGKIPSPLSSLYSAGKYGLRGFADCLRIDLHGSGVGVSAIYPGMIRDAGMFAENGTDLPPGVRTKSPADVAAGVVRAITHDPTEVFVSPTELRVASTLGTVAPGLAATIQRRLGLADRTAPQD